MKAHDFWAIVILAFAAGCATFAVLMTAFKQEWQTSLTVLAVLALVLIVLVPDIRRYHDQLREYNKNRH